MDVMRRFCIVLAASLLAACAPGEVEPPAAIRPTLAFTIEADEGLAAAREITVDTAGNIFVFDYDDYSIHRFDPSGTTLATFGGPAGEEAGFEHLMTIRAVGDSLLALDAGAVSVFDLSGRLRSRRALAETVTCDHPRIDTSGRWAGEWIIEETAEKALTYRDAEGLELDRPAAYLLSEQFPGVEPGAMFFINPTQARAYLYDFLPDGRLLWAVSDEAEIRVRDTDRDAVLFSADWTPLPYPADEIEAMRERQAALNPPLFMNVPERYQLIQHLLVDESGEIWLYIVSNERTGFVHLSPDGRELGFHELAAGFDPAGVRVAAAGGRLYFLLPGRTGSRIYVADRP